MKQGIFVATPAYGGMCYLPYVNGLLELQRACLSAGLEFEYFYLSGTALLHQQRNVAVERFLHSGLSHMMFIDADVGFRGSDVIRMFEQQQDVMLGLYPSKSINWAAVAEAARSDPSAPPERIALYSADYSQTAYAIDGAPSVIRLDAISEIHSGGAGLMMIARGVFETMAQAYPETKVQFPPSYRNLSPDSATMHEHFEFLREPDGRSLSEDLSFCKKWRMCGGKLYACSWFQTVHAGLHLYDGNLPALLGQ
ncbi:hypothetical protein [Burkholderia sp. BCC1977]|uniref:hypothetical protein n=1 Tax=Burkholderia sp. BCC1977 TaxID=2817440 RepID=UPI002ABD5BFF|nr:hypothetical protein [Burkholderia sp. BCC1977]